MPPVGGMNRYTRLLIQSGAVLLLMFLGTGTGVVSFLLLRAGYGFLIWGVLPFLALVISAVVLGAVIWWAAGGTLPGRGCQRETRREPRSGGDV